MCGIVGMMYHDSSREVGASTVIAMRDVAAYRGPDDCGLYLDRNVGLGHRRLSIIDLGGGHQPMADQSVKAWIVFNGEIYNYRELRESLRRSGCVFRTQSDTEVILQLYRQRGRECVKVLNGMFAFAIWDETERRLLLARDRMGVKPLYYANTAEGFVFGSEIKSLFASGLVDAQCRHEAFAEYMLFRQVAGEETLFRGVYVVPPGCTIVVDGRRPSAERYWSRYAARAAQPVSQQGARETFSHLIEDSVRLRLVSDVPVGTFCSGGVDSSLITALAARFKGEGVNTFSIGFDEPGFDESDQATIVSQHCHTTHHRLTVGNLEFDESLSKLVWHNDEPLDFANSVHIYALSRLSRQTVTVVLTGEGSDELFAGYPRYLVPGLARYFRLVPGTLRQWLTSAVGDHRLAKLERTARLDPEDAILFNASYNAPSAVAELCPEIPPFSAPYRQHCVAATRDLGLDMVARLSLSDQETFLLGILLRQDKMSMAASIESRVPFMDYRLVEFANALPASLKVHRGSGKTLVKDYARQLLPSEIVDRRKSGFGVPLALWMRASDGLGRRLLGLAETRGADMFDRRVLTRLVAEHRSGERDHSELLWSAVNLATWRDVFGC